MEVPNYCSPQFEIQNCWLCPSRLEVLQVERQEQRIGRIEELCECRWLRTLKRHSTIHVARSYTEVKTLQPPIHSQDDDNWRVEFPLSSVLTCVTIATSSDLSQDSRVLLLIYALRKVTTTSWWNTCIITPLFISGKFVIAFGIERVVSIHATQYNRHCIP